MGINDRAQDAKAAKKASGSKPSPRTFGEWQGFVNVHLTDSMKKKWFAWAEHPTAFSDALRRICDDGYKVSVRYDERSSAYTAMIVTSDPQHENAGWGLSERAGDPYTAIHRVVYIHATVLEGDWNAHKRSAGYEDDWSK